MKHPVPRSTYFATSTGTIQSSSLGAGSSSASGVTRNESNESRNRPHYCQRSHRGDHWRHPYVNDADRQRQLVGGVSGGGPGGACPPSTIGPLLEPTRSPMTKD